MVAIGCSPRFQHGNPVASYEFHELSISIGDEREVYAGQVENLLSAMVGILQTTHQSQRAGC